MTALTPIHHVTGDINGVALWWAGEKVAVFDSLWDAREAKKTAREANAMLAAIFNPISSETNAQQTAEALRRLIEGE